MALSVLFTIAALGFIPGKPTHPDDAMAGPKPVLVLPPTAPAAPLPQPTQTAVRLERWRNGWRVESVPVRRPGQTPGAAPPLPPVIFVEPGGATAVLSVRVPGGKYTTRGEEAELYLADLVTGAVRPLAAPGVVNRGSWSPGGHWFAFGVGTAPDNTALWVLDARTRSLRRLVRKEGAGARWLRPGLLQHYVLAQGQLFTFSADLPGGVRRDLAGPAEAFRGLLADGRSVVTRGIERTVYVPPVRPAAPLAAPLIRPERTDAGITEAARVSPGDAFVNTLAVAAAGQRLVYAFTRSLGVPGGANTLYVDTLGVYTADGRAWEVDLGFRGDLRDWHLALSPDGRYLFVHYYNNTAEPAQGYHMYDLDARRRLWYHPPREPAMGLFGWEGAKAVIVHCTGVGPGCEVWRVTPDNRWYPWVPGVAQLQLASSGWAWQHDGAWWFRTPGQPIRRLPLADLPPGAAVGEPPVFDPESGFVQVGGAEAGGLYLLRAWAAAWPPEADSGVRR